jgi:hypothetical protein
MTKKSRIRAWQEEEVTGTVMADCLGHQKLAKEYLAKPSVSMPRRITGIIMNGENMP